MDPKEESVWKAIRQKDAGVFERYYKEHYRSFFLMACRYLKDPVQAEEIVNDVFMKIWTDGPSIHIDSSLKSYLYKAVINRSLNALNKNKREPVRLEISDIQNEGYEISQMEENELMLKLYAAIDGLPEKCRQVFELSRFEELKQQEIADRLGISIKTVKNHITIALKQLSKISLKNLILITVFFNNLFGR
jgi:RNA polymerase sigma-70 factor (ECF subfamily)